MKKNVVGIIKDGIINSSKFGKYPDSKLRILWIMKEVNGKNENESWDLRDYLRNISLKKYKVYEYWKATYGLVIKVSWGLLEGVKELKEKQDVEEISCILDYIAVININKEPGKRRTGKKRLENAYAEYSNELRKQIEDIKPNIIIGGSTLWLFYKNDFFHDNSYSNFDDKNWGEFKNGILWINAYHPNQKKIKHKEYYKHIWEKFEENRSRLMV